MKCDTCRYNVGEGASLDYPYPFQWCVKGHWEGWDDDGDDTLPDPWKDCHEFKRKWSRASDAPDFKRKDDPR